MKISGMEAEGATKGGNTKSQWNWTRFARGQLTLLHGAWLVMSDAGVVVAELSVKAPFSVLFNSIISDSAIILIQSR